MALRTPAFNDAKSYGFEWLRAITEANVQEGVVAAGDFKVTAAGAGGMRVDVAAGAAFVKGDSGIAGTGLTQGLFYVVNDATIANAVTLAASDATNPRVDQIVLRVRDSSDLGSGADDAVLEVVQGVATAGATLDNRNGAAALPADRVRLADVLVPAASAAVTAGNIRDRRPWARGAHRRIVRTTNAAGGNDYTTTATSFGVEVDATNLKPRVECSGAPLRVALTWHGSPTTTQAVLGLSVDGALGSNNVPVGDSGMTGVQQNKQAGGAGGYVDLSLSVTLLLPAGSHTIGPQWSIISAGTLTGYARPIIPMFLQIEDLVRQNADNT